MSSALKVKVLSCLNSGKKKILKFGSLDLNSLYIQSESKKILSFCYHCSTKPKFLVHYFDAKSYFEFQKLNFNSLFLFL